MGRRMIYKPMGKRHGIDLGSPEALGRGVMHLFNVDFALEFPRKLPPNVKLVGPLMPEPAKLLPTNLEVTFKYKHMKDTPRPHMTAWVAASP